jgi:hypothetical protein
VGLGPIPYRFAGSNPASRTLSINVILISITLQGDSVASVVKGGLQSLVNR